MLLLQTHTTLLAGQLPVSHSACTAPWKSIKGQLQSAGQHTNVSQWAKPSAAGTSKVVEDTHAGSSGKVVPLQEQAQAAELRHGTQPAVYCHSGLAFKGPPPPLPSISPALAPALLWSL